MKNYQKIRRARISKNDMSQGKRSTGDKKHSAGDNTVGKKRSKLAKLWANKPARIGIIVFIVLAFGGLAWAAFGGKIADFAANGLTGKPAPPPVHYSPLTGVRVDDQSLINRPVTAIMIENSPDARPQSGLKQAGVIFEAVAEGGITRFVVLNQESRPKMIGPVRSVRPYYVEWAAAFDPAVAHVGGSARALKMIRSGKYGVDLDQFYNDGTYWRASDRYAPHNVYTTSNRLDALEKSKKKTSSTFTGWPRTDEKVVSSPNAKHIEMNISSGDYFVTYNYDAGTNSYVRKQGGENHMDREKGQIKPKVAIAIKVKMTVGNEDGYREEITTMGSGDAYIFQNGTVIKGKWQKKDAHAQIKFVDAKSEEIELVRGQTWITAVPQERSVTWR